MSDCISKFGCSQEVAIIALTVIAAMIIVYHVDSSLLQVIIAAILTVMGIDTYARQKQIKSEIESMRR
ncbi:MAG: hypothetical protein QXW26_04685 [Candidatus Nitrosocaldus sp.]